MQKGSKYYKIKKPTAPFLINPSLLFSTFGYLLNVLIIFLTFNFTGRRRWWWRWFWRWRGWRGKLMRNH